jgi:hypothetical protein
MAHFRSIRSCILKRFTEIREDELDFVGRSFESVLMGVKATSERWLRAGMTLRPEDQRHARRLDEFAKRHASESFAAFDDPLEAALFSALVEVFKTLEADDVDP